MTADVAVMRIAESLEAACGVIESELEIINQDLQHAEECYRRYGDVYLAPIRYLMQLRENKKLRYREILGELEALRLQVESSEKLIEVLNHGQQSTAVATGVNATSKGKRPGSRR